MLNEAQLEACSPPGFCRKLSEVIQARADELQMFHRADYISLLIILSTNYTTPHVRCGGIAGLHKESRDSLVAPLNESIGIRKALA